MSEPMDAELPSATGANDSAGDADSVLPPRKPWWRRVSTWIVIVALLLAGAAVAWALSDNTASETVDTVAALSFTSIELTTLEEKTTLDGTLGFVSGDPIVYAGSTNGIVTVTSGTNGTITSLPVEGSTVEEGGVLYSVDEQPVIVFYGEIPAYRSLSTRSTDGTDVLQLEEALTRLGYDEDGDFELDGDFTSATRDAIKALQEDLGIDDTGVLALGSYVFFDGPIYVAETMLDVGDPINPGTPVVATSTMPSGTVTAIAGEGDVLAHGDPLLVVEGNPVTLFVTDIPFYRTLTVGSVGDDVQVLETSLVSFGFDAGGTLTVDDTFDETTRETVTAWQAAIGAPVDGVVNIGEIIVIDDPIRIATAHVGVGSNVAPGTMLVTPSTSTSVVSVQLPAENQDLVVVGDPVNVVMPDESDESGTVTAIGSIAIRSPESGTYFELEVTLDRDGAGAGLDEAPVEVEIVDDRAVDVLAVPVSALLALSEGGYAVEIDTGGSATTLVGVEVGMYADGFVEVTSSQLVAGMQVVAP